MMWPQIFLIWVFLALPVPQNPGLEQDANSDPRAPWVHEHDTSQIQTPVVSLGSLEGLELYVKEPLGLER